MREILFRGRRKDTGEWVYWTCMGKLHQTQNGKLMSGTTGLTEWAYELLSIDDDTIGQYTGITDKHGKYVFEGDMIRHCNDCPDAELEEKGVVFWDEEYCGWRRTSNGAFHRGAVDTYRLSWECVYEVIGNIHDDPELMEEASHAAD